MSETINNINEKIFELSKAIILVGKLIKNSYEKDSEDRSYLLKESELKAESLIREELRKITEYSLQYEEFDEGHATRNTPESWRIEGIINRSAFVDKKGKFYFRIVLTAPEVQYDETIDKHIFVMDYFPIQDEIYYNLDGMGYFKIEKASAPMKKVQKLKMTAI